MKIFEHPNISNDWKCPVCLKNSDIPIVLVGMISEIDGSILKAEQVHIDCMELQYDPLEKVFYQLF